jgi:hypothetical protein
LSSWLLQARTWFSDVDVVMMSRAQKRVLWRQRLADLEASGMTQAAYCAARGIGYSTLQRLLAAMDGRPWLITSLLYGTGMRRMTGTMTRCGEAHRVRLARMRQETQCGGASGASTGLR